MQTPFVRPYGGAPGGLETGPGGRVRSGRTGGTPWAILRDSQFSAWEVLSTWSSCAPFGKASSSDMYVASHGASRGGSTCPASNFGACADSRASLSK